MFAENSQILLKISVIPILLTFIYLVTLSVSKQSTQLIVQLKSLFRHIIVTMLASHQDTSTDHGIVRWMRKDQQSISWVDGATCPAGPATPFGISSSRVWISVDSLVSFQFDELFLGTFPLNPPTYFKA